MLEAVGGLLVKDGRFTAAAPQLFCSALAQVDSLALVFTNEGARAKIVAALLTRLRSSLHDALISESICLCLSELSRERDFRVRRTQIREPALF